MKLKTKWIEVLRSGKYSQCRNKLRSQDGEKYCAIGVLLNIINETAWKRNNGHYIWLKPNYYGHYLQETDLQKIIDLNDIDGFTFEEIADWIENELSCESE